MDRLGFFSYLKKSLVDTVKEISAPFIEEDIKKFDRMIETVTGVKWFPVHGMQLNDEIGFKDLYIENKHLLSYFNGEDVRVYEKVCPNCHVHVHVISYDKTLKCFQCDTTYHIIDRQEEQKLKEYEVKWEDGIWYVGIY